MKLWFYVILITVAVGVTACELVTPGQTESLDADAGPDQVVPTDEAFRLIAMATGGVSPYRFRWSLEDQPSESTFAITDANTNALLEVNPLPVNGRYLFRVRATDSIGQTNASFVEVLVGGDLELTATAADTLRIVGQPTQLDVSLDVGSSGFSDLTFAWEVIEGSADFDDPSVQSPQVTVTSGTTARLRITVTGIENGIERFGVQDVFVVGVEDSTPQVIIQNSGSVEGRIVIELLTEAAPNTCANFLRYVDDGYYAGVFWHRVVSEFVIQTGNFTRDPVGEIIEQVGTRPTIASEANNGFSNQRTAIAMALRGTDADSGSNQFFINLNTNGHLDDGAPPFTVFARVVEGMDIADAIVALPTGGDGAMADQPTEDVIMTSVTRAESKIPVSPPDDIRSVDTNGMDDVDTNGMDDADTNGAEDNSDPAISVTTTTSVPIQLVDQTVELNTNVENEPDGTFFTWTSSNGLADFEDRTAASTTATIRSNATVILKLRVRGPAGDTLSVQRVVVVGIPNALPRVVIENSGGVNGNITLELLTEIAPGTCANFLRYIDDGFYEGLVWHRVVSGFVIQAGGFKRSDGSLTEAEGLREPILSEANNGESNIRGNLAIALRGSDANSGTSQLFINLDDNSRLDDGSPPFTVFARVVEGLDVVDQIEAVEVGSEGSFQDVPVEDIVIDRIRRVDP